MTDNIEPKDTLNDSRKPINTLKESEKVNTSKPVSVDSPFGGIPHIILTRLNEGGYVGYGGVGQAEKELQLYIYQETTKAVTKELKQLWNKTQPDIIPEGTPPLPIDGQIISDRINQLQSTLKEDK